MINKFCFVLLAAALTMTAQDRMTSLTSDRATAEMALAGAPLPSHSVAQPPAEGSAGTPVHPVHYVFRRPKAGCAQTAVCGEIYAEGDTHNMRTSAGTTWQYNQMAGSTAAVGTYMALTNNALTLAEADTVLAGEISANGLSRALGTPTNSSGTLSVPGTPAATPYGTTGSTTYYYWAAECNQGLCTTPSAASGTTSTANATLTASNGVSVVWTENLGAAAHQLYRTTTNTAPSGTVSVLVGGVATCVPAGAGQQTCTQLDTSNTLTSVAIPASNLTNFGKYTLVYTWTCNTAAQQLQGFAILNAASSGTMIFEGTLTQYSMNIGDTFQLAETVYY